ncbi:NAD(P)/FAD-dependent oxidoreductase [Roseococcus pinisoli]|uniref:FAD-dependent oxidoreductase n=1 Tax=Roseococcus pinisoli TaxID=2835040 RepID=A0ABS5QJG4_9PROT|nr:FAD-dependent oxidoreductase [Roseococcus pinisoli]MBS7813643.1 FAD-dependent oxidoreductase [Roseococcus pinisoli]
MRTAIIGAGQAGRRTAELLRGLDAEREILLLGEETEPPYDRPPLSKEVLLGEERPRGLMQRAAEVYEAQRIALRLGEKVTRIDLGAARLETAAGECIAYDSLVIATGARARGLRIPGADDPRVLTLRSIADARALRARLRTGLRLVVAGAGLIGLEVAAAAIQLGCAVTVLEMGERAMARCVPEAVSARIEAWHRAAGVVLEFGCPLTAIRPQPDAIHLVTGKGEVSADLLLVAVGAIPNMELALDAGIAVDDGILTDADGRTSHPHVFAAGEVARIWQRGAGRHVRFETWQVAQHQPVAVANALCGEQKPYAELPWHWTDQYGRNVQILGTHSAALEWLEREDGGRLIYFGVDPEERVHSAVLIDNGREATPLRRIIAAEKPIQRNRLLDPSVALRQLC